MCDRISIKVVIDRASVLSLSKHFGVIVFVNEEKDLSLKNLRIDNALRRTLIRKNSLYWKKQILKCNIFNIQYFNLPTISCDVFLEELTFIRNVLV